MAQQATKTSVLKKAGAVVVAGSAIAVTSPDAQAADPNYPIIFDRIGSVISHSTWGLSAAGVRAGYDHGATQLDATNYTLSYVGETQQANVLGGQVAAGASGWLGRLEWSGWIDPAPPRPDLSNRHPNNNIVVRFNVSYSLTQAQWKTVGCHEWGHAGGIGERSAAMGDPSCLQNPVNYNYSGFSGNEVWWFNQIAAQ